MTSGKRIKLITFNGDPFGPDNCDPAEDYWKLIGKIGTVVGPENGNNRVLVQFDESVSALGLHCHNNVPNSLLILASDLEFLECA
jgi:hypothetical protein